MANCVFLMGGMFDRGPLDARPFNQVQQYVADLIRSKVIIGHTLWSDLSGRSRRSRALSTPHRVCCSLMLLLPSIRPAVLGIPHPAITTRDVALYQPFRNALQATQVVGLQTLMWKLMRRRVQQTHLCPVCGSLVRRYSCR